MTQPLKAGCSLRRTGCSHLLQTAALNSPSELERCVPALPQKP